MRLERRYQLGEARVAEAPSAPDGNLVRILLGSVLMIAFLLSMAIVTQDHDPDVATLASTQGYGVSQ
jgi:hypothetical protein